MQKFLSGRYKQTLALSLGVSLVALLAINVLFSGLNSISELKHWLEEIDWRFIALACTSFFVALVCRVLRLRSLTSILTPDFSLPELIQIVFMYQFGNAVTPFSSGGVAVQIYVLTQKGASSARATAVSMVEAALKWFFFVILTFILCLVYWRGLEAATWGYFLLSVLLILVLVVGLVAVLYDPRLISRMPGRLAAFVNISGSSQERIDALQERIEDVVTRIRDGLKELWKENRNGVFALMLYSLLYWVFYLMVAPLVLNALGLEISVLELWFLQTLYRVLTTFIPTPGGSGGVEVVIGTLFSSLIPSSFVGPAVTLWRVITFYLPVFLGTLLAVRFLYRLTASEDTPD